MKLADSELHVAKRVRRGLRWQTTGLWILGMFSVSCLGIATIVFAMLVSHLHRHGLPVSSLMKVLSDLQHPSGIQPLFVLTSTTMTLMCLLLALYCAFALFAVVRTGRERRLLLRLLNEDKAEEKGKGRKG